MPNDVLAGFAIGSLVSGDKVSEAPTGEEGDDD
jgi:hypothetical protein